MRIIARIESSNLIKIFEHDRYDGMLKGLCKYKGKIQYAWLVDWDADNWEYDIYSLSVFQRYWLLIGKFLFELMVGMHSSYDNRGWINRIGKLRDERLRDFYFKYLNRFFRFKPPELRGRHH